MRLNRRAEKAQVAKKAQPIHHGEVAMGLLADLQTLVQEIHARRVLHSDLEVFFELYPDIAERFGKLQEDRRKR